MTTNSDTRPDGWQPISTAPKNEQVLLYYPPIHHKWRGQTHTHYMRVGYVGDTPRAASHWMSIPAYPAPTKDQPQ